MMWSNAGRFAKEGIVVSRKVGVVNHSSGDTASDADEDCSSSDTAGCASDNTADSEGPTLLPAPTLLSITRRRAGFGVCKDHFVERHRDVSPTEPRDITSVQELFSAHALAAAKLFPTSLWRILAAVKTESKITQTKVLQAVAPLLHRDERANWPLSRKTIDYKLKKIGCFSSRITRRVRVDLSHHNLSGLDQPISFAFMDPIYAWATCARELSREHELQFEYKPRFHPSTHENLYGVSVSCGDIMLESIARCPISRCPTKPALIGLSYDSGQASRRRSYTPILISVGNTDYNGMHACICIGYMPNIDIATHDNEKAQDAMHELRQCCIGAIVDVIESCGENGFVCRLYKKLGNNQYVVQHPLEHTDR